MNKLLEDLITGMNPLHDFDDIRFYNLRDKESISEMWDEQKKNMLNILTIPKSIIRGCVVGGTVGTIVSLVTGSSPYEGARSGIILGSFVDFEQYMVRWGYHYFKAQRLI